MKVYGLWRGQVSHIQGENILTRSLHRSPLKTARPFRGEAGELILYLMDASPGLFNGDIQEIDGTVERNAWLYLTNQASCKLQPSPQPAVSRQLQRFRVEEGGILEYFPEPVVPYREARHRGETVLHMHAGGQAFIGEILTPGRVGRGERFLYEQVESRISVYWDGEWTVWDSLCLSPGSGTDVRAMLGGYTHIGTLWVLSKQVHASLVRDVQDLLHSATGSVYAGASLLPKNGMVIRLLGNSVHELQTWMIHSWDRVRRELQGRGAFQVRK